MMKGRVPKFGIFFMVVLIVMGLGLLVIGDDEDGESASDEAAPAGQATPESRQ
ncbi:MAG: hypothetical protein U5O39_07260 [Gammaproteobacteria bacterium]|nr:hypothetical protein [Gammaproteobacteria bacterium]